MRMQRFCCVMAASSLGYRRDADCAMENLASASAASAGAPPSTSSAFLRNPHTSRHLAARPRRRTAPAPTSPSTASSLPAARHHDRYEDLLEAPDVDIISIATPNHLHAAQAVAAARAGKHMLLEKPTGLDDGRTGADPRRGPARRRADDCLLRAALQPVSEIRALAADVGGWLGDIRFARTQYLSRVTDWYAGWDWVRTRASGRSHLLAAGCHAVDALRWCSGLEPRRGQRVSHALHRGLRVADLDSSPTCTLGGGALGHVTSSTDFMLPYNVPRGADGRSGDAAAGPAAVRSTRRSTSSALRGGESLSRRALAQRPTSWRPPGDPHRSARCPDPPTSAIIRSRRRSTNSSTCVLEGRDTSIDVFDAQKTMEVCLGSGPIGRARWHAGRAATHKLMTRPQKLPL